MAGSAGGIQLAAAGPATRPLADRVKQAIFGSLEPLLPGSAVLDLCAGSGAAAIEALSRGAARAVLVERDDAAVAVIRENLRRTGLAATATVVRREVLAALRDPEMRADRFDLAIVDPPYAETALRDAILAILGARRRAAPGRRHRDRHRPLARGAARRGGTATIDAGPPLRRNRDHPVPPGPGRGRGRGLIGGGMRTAVYPGSFDPITLGHVDVLGRAAGVFDRVVVAVLVNPRKAPVGEADGRIAAIVEAVAEALPDLAGRIEVRVFDGLTVDACRASGARHIVRGLRAVSDFEAELQMAHMNHRLAPEIDTVFFMTALEYGYLSSSLVKEIARFGGDVSAMVPAGVAARLRASAEESPRL